LTEFTNLTDTRTDRHTDIGCTCIASHGKNSTQAQI